MSEVTPKADPERRAELYAKSRSLINLRSTQRLKALEYLKQLNDIRENLKAKSIDKRLTELNFFDRTSKLFSPITETVKKQAENINENLDVLKKSLNNQQIQLLSSQNISTLPPADLHKSIKNHSIFLPHDQQQNGDIFLKLKNRDSPQILFNIKNPHLIKLYKNNNSEEMVTGITEGVRTLLFDENPNVNNITSDDFEYYLRIYQYIGKKPGDGKRIKNITNSHPNKKYLRSALNAFNNKTQRVAQSEKPVITTGKGLAGKQLLKLNCNNSCNGDKVMKRLSVLLTAYKAGHTNVLQEMTEILDNLVERKIINKKQYLEYLK